MDTAEGGWQRFKLTRSRTGPLQSPAESLQSVMWVQLPPREAKRTEGRTGLNRILLIHNQTGSGWAVSAPEARKSAQMAAEAYIWYFEQAMSRLTQPAGMIAGQDDPV